jgi:hypothetical protein
MKVRLQYFPFSITKMVEKTRQKLFVTQKIKDIEILSETRIYHYLSTTKEIDKTERDIKDSKIQKGKRLKANFQLEMSIVKIERSLVQIK